MPIDIQFRGNKVVVTETVPDAQINYAIRIVTDACEGRLQFAWRRFRSGLKTYYKSETRAQKWAENNAYDAMPDEHSKKQWISNLNRLHKCLEILSSAKHITSYYVDGTGYLQITYADGNKFSMKPVYAHKGRILGGGYVKLLDGDRIIFPMPKHDNRDPESLMPWYHVDTEAEIAMKKIRAELESQIDKNAMIGEIDPMRESYKLRIVLRRRVTVAKDCDRKQKEV